MTFKRCAVFASGSGSNFQALIDKKNSGLLHVDFAVLVSNNSKAGAIIRARSHDIPSVHCAPSHFTSESEYATHLLEMLQSYNTDFIVLAGYMKKLPSIVLQRFANKVLNIHPSLLPAFGGQGMYGHFVHEAVIAAGVKLSGVTVHLVDEEYDKGPIVLQETVPVLDDDTPESLAARVLIKEHDIYWRGVNALASGHLVVCSDQSHGIS